MDNNLIKHLEALNELQNSENNKLTQSEKQTLEEIINLAKFNNLIKTKEELVAEDQEIDNFQPDPALKDIFTNVSSSLVIDALNEQFNTNFDNTKKITFISTEFVGTTGDITKRIIRGDFGAVIEDEQSGEVGNTIIIEFQSDHKTKISFRVHGYGSNNLTAVKMEVKTGKGESKEKKLVYVRPYELVIYTSTEFNKKSGYLDFYTTAPNYQVNGVEQSAKEGDAVNFQIPFVNILKMSLEDIKNSKFSFLQGIYLYKYKQNMELVDTENVKLSKLSQEIEKNLRNSLSKEDYNIVMRQHINLMNDIYNIMSKQPYKYKEEINTMNYMTNTFAGRAEQRGIEQGVERGIGIGIERGIGIGIERGIEQGVERGIEQGIERGVEQGVEKERANSYKDKINSILKMMNDLPDTKISTYFSMPIEEVARIREEQFKLEED